MSYTLSDNSIWNYRQKIYVNTDGISLSGNIAAPHNFHIDNNARWTGGNNFWAQVSDTQGNIAFTSSDGSTVLDYAIKDWVYASQSMWVDVEHTWTSGADTIIYLYYGYVSGGSYPKAASDFQSAYDANFLAVWPLNDDPNTSTVQDATAGNWDGTKGAAGAPAEATGIAGKAQSFDGIDDKVSVGAMMSISPTATFTIEVWTRMPVLPTGRQDITFNICDANLFTGGLQTDGNQKWMCTAGRASVADQSISDSSVLTIDTWYHLVGVFFSGSFKFYRNSTLINTVSYNATTNGASANNLGRTFGRTTYAGTDYYPWKGLLDEASFSNVSRSADWVIIRYKAIASQDDWGTVGTNYLQADAGETTATVIKDFIGGGYILVPR